MYKTICLSDEIYNRVIAARLPGETIDAVVRRLIGLEPLNIRRGRPPFPKNASANRILDDLIQKLDHKDYISFGIVEYKISLLISRKVKLRFKRAGRKCLVIRLASGLSFQYYEGTNWNAPRADGSAPRYYHLKQEDIL